MSRYEFFILMIVILSVTGLLGSCTYQSFSCRQEAIKAKIDPIQIGKICGS